MKKSNVADNSDEFFRLVQKSLSWKYLGGSHNLPLCHRTSDWRVLPYLVIVCTVEGEYQSEIEGVGLQRIFKDEVLLVPGKVRHTVAMPKQGVVHHAHIRFTVFDSVDILQFFTVPFVLRGKAAREITRTTCKFHEAMSQQVVSYNSIRKAIHAQQLSSQLLEQIVNVSEAKESMGNLADTPRLEPVFRYVEENMAHPIRRENLAKLAFLSETHFHYVFKNLMGMSPMAYVKSVRMRKAQLLLMQTQLRIEEVGTSVGYPDIFHFSKVFKEAAGTSPNNYRKSLLRWFEEGHV